MTSMKERGPWQDDFDARPACAGKSLVQRMEDTLDVLMWKIALGPTDLLRGEAYGIAQCIALVRTPYDPDVTAVRNAAVQRHDDSVREMEISR